MTDTQTLRNTLKAQLGPMCGVAVGRVDDLSTGCLFPPEEKAMARAIEQRRREFTAGRHAARLALKEIGHRAVAIPVGRDRAPEWPSGITGSISHTQDYALAAVTERTPHLTAIGIDAEPAAPLSPDMMEVVLSGVEAQKIKAWPGLSPGMAALLHFCAKEAAYKAIYPISRHIMGFEALELTFDRTAGRFRARLKTDIPVFPQNTCFDGAFAVLPGTVLCSVTIIG